ncbi:MAG: helix-turn-helix domain-containing protein [Bacteroidetes bacterium]|jgi:transcriptional regulator with XRE-family HTH domain|nr:helix-turn-helix domain-containing protein [Bacteroidota bacterium]MBT4338135.1 helix-turn-helix domain-containing protein [Bacteroidota bacterium]MBT4728383.1 helix-turn-helix domain-containing protein [Bacteroidota bacterium]MBT5990922.1 helix-turn-helix domain-containing protein [Bacteroidota bacterium]MBT7827162.1 helix-turn-helix domain-containing protein [Bacteroidota bacterium]
MKNNVLAKRVKELRMRNGYSQEELSDLSGLSLRTIQRIEGGENEPRGDSLKRLSNVFNVTPETLTDWTIKVDIGYLTNLNLASLTFIFFPLLGILVPLIMWISKKDTISHVKLLGKQIMNFQITWTILFFLGYFIIVLNLANNANPLNTFSPEILVTNLKRIILFIGIMYLFNITMIIINTVRIANEKDAKYFPKISFLGNQ